MVPPRLNRPSLPLVQSATLLAAPGESSQREARTRAMAEFKQGTLQVLVATDIAARGIDIIELPHVVNFELPNVPEDYVHRIGRTGRAGSEGEATSLVCIDELKLLADIEKMMKRKVPQRVLAGFEPNPHIKAEPIISGQNRGQRPENGQRQGRPGGASRPHAKPTVKPVGIRGGKPQVRRPSVHNAAGRSR